MTPAVLDSKPGLGIMKIKTIQTIITTSLAFVVVVMTFSSNLNAEKHLQIINGKEVVVHSNPIPVILHRMVPPQLGRHVTQKEVSKGTLARPQSSSSVRKRTN